MMQVKDEIAIEKLSADLKDAYAHLSGMTEEQLQAELNLMSAEAWLEESRNKILLKFEPKELGANEAQREANLNAHCAEQVEKFQQAERERIMVRSHMEKAKLQIEGLRAQLRILELAAGIQRAA
ncbi:MAG: hypothetical protein JWN14_24 [Chthonomonadales bacterium]|nr:hypothetical protein [Chthonomonadales bacterium]